MSANYKLPNYTVYFDANVAYSKKPSEPISARLLKSIEKARMLTRIDVRVPEVVLEELAYQQFVIAHAAGDNLKKNYKTLLDVCGLTGSQAPDVEALKAGVTSLLCKSLDKASFSKISTPIADIDWAAVVHDSCWRCAPFEKPRSDDDLAEKGFRDKIILETIKVDVSTIKAEVVAFVSGDDLLRTAFKDQATTQCPTEAYSHFGELLGHLELLAKTKSTAFTNEVLSNVAAFFYTPDDPSCVAISQGIIGKLINEYSEEMSRPPLFSIGQPKQSQITNQFSALTQTPVVPPLSGNWFEEFQRWTPVTPVKLIASPPVFQPDQKDARYHWISTVTLVRLLRRTEPRSGQVYSVPEERVRTKEVDVKWSCKIHPGTAKFSDPVVERCTATFRDGFIEANFHTRSTYDLPLFAGFEEQNV
jgi:hypothetical protein